MSKGSHSISSPPGTRQTFDGIAGSPGYAIGSALVIDTRRAGIARRHIQPEYASAEMVRFDNAVEVAAVELREVAEGARNRSTRVEASILEAYLLMVEDETLRAEVETRVREELLCVEWALGNAIAHMSERLRNSGDAYLAERSHDVEFVATRILRALAGSPLQPLELEEDQGPAIVVAHDLSPAETAVFSRDRVLGLVTEVGTRTSHTAILARALELPAVVGISQLLSQVGTGDLLVVDGVRGRVILNPHGDDLTEARERSRIYSERRLESRRSLGDKPVATRCGVQITLGANIELPSEAEIALQQGARGIGLYRTEFLYINRTELPTEDEQYETYRNVVRALSPLPVTLRTFDIGGDKFMSALQVPFEMNPALGLRAVRLGLAHPHLMLTQLRAMVRASAHGALRIMVPMIASLRELRAVRLLLNQAIAEVDKAGHTRAQQIPFGIMVEVPSAAILANEFAQLTDFMSIGTNDLVQYALAVDRSSPILADLASFFDPAILKLIQGVITAGQRWLKPVVLCGAMASDPLAALLLVGMGLRELSMEASAIPEVREALASTTLEEALRAAEQACCQSTSEEVEQVLTEHFASRLAQRY